MRIYVKVLNGQECSLVETKYLHNDEGGSQGKEVSASSEVQEVKDLIHTLLSIPAEDQKLLYQGKVMLDKKFLKDYEVQDGSKLTLMVKTSAKISRDTTSLESSDSNSSMQMPLAPVWEHLHTFLKRHYVEKDAELVLVEFRKSFDRGLAELSLDDIERLAATKLRQL